MKQKYYILAAIVALVVPFLLMPIIYPIGQLFLPNGNLVLTPAIRVICTIIIAIFDYALAYIFIMKTTKHKKIVFNSICFFLTLLWNVLLGMLWYFVAI